jgi:DNA polymerase/3'-5' exonuclease PolX
LKKYTYKQIAEITGNKVENLRKLAYKLGLKKYIIRNVTKIDQTGLDKIQAHLAPKISKINNKYKLRVIERYFETESYRDVAQICKINHKTVKKIVCEWKETGFITIDSCINFPEKQQNKGIFYRNNKWGYSFTYKGERYYKRGFEQEGEALEALYKLREELRSKNE